MSGELSKSMSGERWLSIGQDQGGVGARRVWRQRRVRGRAGDWEGISGYAVRTQIGRKAMPK